MAFFNVDIGEESCCGETGESDDAINEHWKLETPIFEVYDRLKES